MDQCHHCLICLGSNYQGIWHLKNAEKEIGKISLHVYWGQIIKTEAENTDTTVPYFNRAASLYTSLNKELLIKTFKSIECRHGRTFSSKQNGIIPLDIDLLIYDNEIVKPTDLKKKYVQQALQSVPTDGII